jgi:BirA family biotin operon repressor/biotin-[acetyl-CoA-carboxylase] ligase
MEEARLLETRGEASGTVIAAGEQKKGRGRGENRIWRDSGKSLLFTILLRYEGEPLPALITLRAGLAVAKAIESLLRDMAACASDVKCAESAALPCVEIKWPNDIMLDGKKVCGIIAESDGKNVFTGIGVNVLPQNFDGLPNASSVINRRTWNEKAAEPYPSSDIRFILLEKILTALHDELSAEDTIQRLDKKLFMRGRRVVFLNGQVDSNREVRGILSGVSRSGGIIITDGEAVREYITGELRF